MSAASRAATACPAATDRCQVLHGIDLTVEEGQVVVVLGANGAGKTTTLRAISGMITTKGDDHLRRRLASPAGIPRRWPSTGIAHVPQGRGTFVDLTVEENLRLGAVHPQGRRGRRRSRSAGTSGSPFSANGASQAAGSMSGGEQQMLAIARAMMGRPRLLLLDEPSLGLAPLITRELFGRLGDFNREDGLTILVVEQNANLALDIGHYGYVLETGRIATSGSAERSPKRRRRPQGLPGVLNRAPVHLTAPQRHRQRGGVRVGRPGVGPHLSARRAS